MTLEQFNEEAESARLSAQRNAPTVEMRDESKSKFGEARNDGNEEHRPEFRILVLTELEQKDTHQEVNAWKDGVG